MGMRISPYNFSYSASSTKINPLDQNPSSSITMLSKTHLNYPPLIPNYNDNHDEDESSKPSSLLTKFGMACFMGFNEENYTKKKLKNRAWLVAESGGDLANTEPHSSHSSFRFTISSRLDLDSIKVGAGSPTVLMANLDNTMSMSDSGSKEEEEEEEEEEEMKWCRIQSLENIISPFSPSLITFTYAQILSATSNFSPGKLLGRGALSYVYRGRIGLLRTCVAIKKLDKEDNETPKAFCRELMIATSLQHPNIVPLLGFCIHPTQGFFLVYKFVSSGTLDRHLHGMKGVASLSWPVRYKVAIGIAEAIEYQHNGTDRCIVHRDIKPSNILLSSKKRPKLCDFGLATWTPAPSIPFLCKTVKGTFGYLAPEYFQHGKVSDKTDVYAFGVVLLELLTGRKPIESSRPPGEVNLVQWAKPRLDKGEIGIDSLIDRRAKVTLKSSKLVSKMGRAASACTNSDESCRPSITEVITLLKGETWGVKGKANCKPRFSRNNGSVHHALLHPTETDMTNHMALAMVDDN